MSSNAMLPPNKLHSPSNRHISRHNTDNAQYTPKPHKPITISHSSDKILPSTSQRSTTGTSSTLKRSQSNTLNIVHELTPIQQHNQYLDNIEIDSRLPNDCSHNIKLKKELWKQLQFQPNSTQWLPHTQCKHLLIDFTVYIVGFDSIAHKILRKIGIGLSNGTAHTSILPYNITDLTQHNTIVVTSRRSILIEYYSVIKGIEIPNNIVCVSCNWLLQCYIDQTLLPYHPYILPNDIQPINTKIIVQQKLPPRTQSRILDRSASLLNSNKRSSTSNTTRSNSSSSRSNSDNINIFHNKVILFRAHYNDNQNTALRELVIKYGGRVATAEECEHTTAPDYVVVAKKVGWLVQYRTAYPYIHTNYVTEEWLQRCVEQHRIIDNDISVMSIPKSADRNVDVVTEMKQYTICITGGYCVDEYKSVKQAIEQSGAVFSDTMTNKVTHLICKRSGGEKYIWAQSHNIPCIHIQWLVRCLWTGLLQDTTSYIMTVDTTTAVSQTHSDASINSIQNSTMNETTGIIGTAYADNIRNAVKQTSTESQLATNITYINNNDIDNTYMNNISTVDIDELDAIVDIVPHKRVAVATDENELDILDVSIIESTLSQHSEPIMSQYSTNDYDESIVLLPATNADIDNQQQPMALLA